MKKYIIILILSAAASLFSSCTSPAAKTGQDGIKVAVSHEIKYSNKGSRSEGRSGYLKINSIVVPDCFAAIVAEGKLYTFSSKNMAWGDDGYFPLEDGSVESVYPSVNKKISDSDLARGWSEVAGKCQNVPSNWIFVKWNNGSAAVLPDKIDLLIKTKSIGTIPRNTMFSEKMLNKK